MPNSRKLFSYHRSHKLISLPVGSMPKSASSPVWVSSQMRMYPTLHTLDQSKHFSRYDIFAINIASTMLGYVYGHAKGPALTSAQDLGIKIATPVGTLIGQLVFGWLGDVVGRKRICMYSFFPSLHLYLLMSLNRRCRTHDHHRRYFCSSSLGKFWRCQNYRCFGCLACHRNLTSFDNVIPQSHSILRPALVSVVITLWVLSFPRNSLPQTFVVVWWLLSSPLRVGATLVRTNLSSVSIPHF